MLRNALFAGTKAPRLRTDRADMGHPAGEIGDGTIEGDSSADYACGSAFSPFSRLFGIGATYQWFYRDTQYVFKKMEPCPDPMDPKPAPPTKGSTMIRSRGYMRSECTHISRFSA